MTHFRTPMVYNGHHCCPDHKGVSGDPLALTLIADDYAYPNEYYICPKDDQKFTCDHRHDYDDPES